MKLNVNFANLLATVREMGAEEFAVDWNFERMPLEPIDIKLLEGLEIEFDEIDFSSGLASYEGRQILLYIQDHGTGIEQALEDGSKGRKFHVADCSTLDNMRERGRFDRYVVTNRLDGVFDISGSDYETGTSITGQTQLRVCKNCLKFLNYKNYERRRTAVFNQFSIEEFFDTFSSFFKYLPSGVAERDEATYTNDWPSISDRIRRESDYQCQQCSVKLESAKNLLHVHHVDGVKTNNSSHNLRPLCADCHKKQPMHGHMYVSHEAIISINELRSRQGINIINSWDDVLLHSDASLEGIIHWIKNNFLIELPSVGIRENGHYIDLAWPSKRIGLCIDPDVALKLTNEGWRMWTLRSALKEFENFESSIIR